MSSHHMAEELNIHHDIVFNQIEKGSKKRPMSHELT